MKSNNFKGANVLITGGAGFIGSSLTHVLVRQGAIITVFDAMIRPYGGNMFNLKHIKEKITFIKDDIRSRVAMKKAVKGKDFVFHLAAQTGRILSMQDPFLDLDINCNGTLSLLEAIRGERRNIKLVFASSRGVIGKPTYFPVDEKHPAYPRDIYGLNKLAAEKYCFLYAKEYGFGASVVRLNNVYGPRCQIKSNHYGTINLFIRYALEKNTLPIYGDGKQTRDYLYVDDAVDALISIANRRADGEYFFAGSGYEYSLLDIVELIKKNIHTTKYVKRAYPKQLGQIDFPRFVSSYQKLQEMLSWSPKVSLEEGIQRTVAFYRDNLKYYL